MDVQGVANIGRHVDFKGGSGVTMDGIQGRLVSGVWSYYFRESLGQSPVVLYIVRLYRLVISVGSVLGLEDK